MLRVALVLAIVLAIAVKVQAATAIATINSIDPNGIGAALGQITFKDTEKGLLITPDLSGLPPGAHGFHIHEKGSCAPAQQNGKKVAGLAAAGHYDPQHTGKHEGPNHSQGHQGDLPVLVVSPDGKAKHPLSASRLTVSDIRGHSIMIHGGGDNYADQPAPLGGGGARIACGVIK
jgi:superoxide dismutase, Cu-Zn family